jgi:hypothetical protein
VAPERIEATLDVTEIEVSTGTDVIVRDRVVEATPWVAVPVTVIG